MNDTTYVVHLVDCGRQHPFKQFKRRTGAASFATQQTSCGTASRAEVFELTDIGDAKEAVAALINGKGDLVEIRFSPASHDTLDHDTLNREWKQVQTGQWPGIFKFFGML
jgi:hypothetical protein